MSNFEKLWGEREYIRIKLDDLRQEKKILDPFEFDAEEDYSKRIERIVQDIKLLEKAERDITHQIETQFPLKREKEREEEAEEEEEEEEEEEKKK